MPNSQPADFRDAAVRQSLAFLEAAAAKAGRPADPMSAGFSLCVPAEDEGPRAIHRIGWTAMLWASFGLVCMIGSVLTAFLASARIRPLGLLFATLSLLPLVCGTVLSATFSVRKVIRRRLGQLPRNVVFCDLEDSQTIARQKVVLDDFVLLFPMPQERAIRLEGLKYRYVVYGKDVTLLATPVGHVKHVQLDCRIGDVVLSFMLQQRTIARAFANSFGGTSSGFRRHLADTLGYAQQDDRTYGFPVARLAPMAAPPPLPAPDRQNTIASLARGGIFVVYLQNGASPKYLDYAQGSERIFPLFSSRDLAMRFLRSRGFEPSAIGHVCSAVSAAWLQHPTFASYCLLVDPGDPTQMQLTAADLAILAQHDAAITQHQSSQPTASA